jgi:predicted transposase/invertase (TIGR01784 family)
METLNTNRLISLLTDYGFKITFANEKNRKFVQKAIQLLIKSPVPIKSLKHLPTEFEGIVEEARKGFYDTMCQTDKGTFFIIEMQVGNYGNLLERLLYYVSQLYASQVTKGKKGFASLSPVYCICIVKDTIFNDTPAFYHKSMFRSEEGMVLIDKMQLIVVELAKFNKKAHELNNELEELLFTMSNAHTIDLSQPLTIPPFWKKEWLQDVIKELNLSSMSAQNRALFNISVARVMAINDEFEREQKKAEIRGAKQAKINTQTEAVQKLLKREKLTVEEIAEDIGVSVDFVLKIQAKMK